ncbi:hypothetical protein [Stigmatella erecta]|uniref:Nucleoside-specific outer membrane channel protein Tsx n=1 Tax=Stigmatella erecta TaxID=83460 RepID=A0A1I0D6G5_9BACT|nr:hypothetical protein [Stigmatella erecta]SET27801.1 hypothetical protein SAMN05443639_102403 [Stigmatella erecta]
MFRSALLAATLFAVFLSPLNAHAGVWFELLRAPCLTGNGDDIKQDNGVIGRYRGAIDCFNKDFNGDGSRTILSIKAFQAWEYGTMFLYYDITGPFNSGAASDLIPNERNGFFGGITVTLSPKRIAEKATGRQFQWGLLSDVSLKYEAEHVSKFGMLSYYGLQWDLAVPVLDFMNVTTVIRDDASFEGIDFQVGAAFQKSFSILSQDFILSGFFQTGLFGEGAGKGANAGSEGNQFFLAQPQFLWDFGKPLHFTPGKLYAGFEWQVAWNRYLIEGKTENVLQGMIRWNI